MSLRDELLNQLRTQPFDLLIIGGGIVGAGIARDATMRGLRVALIEKGDFASGTSSKTSKLIHGGLRYLEQGHLRLVVESVKERRILRAIAPQLVWPLSLTIPLYRGDSRPRWKIAAGLLLYDLLALPCTRPAHHIASPGELLRREPGLNPTGLRGAASYTDCQMDDARLCLANILQAVSFGAVCGNYVALRAFTKTSGRLSGAVVQDIRTAQVFEVRAGLVVNATGPWSDAIRRLSDSTVPARLAPTKGVHLVVPRLTNDAFFFQARSDQRMLFLLPWGAYSLIGTTESPEVDDLETLRATGNDVDYLLSEVNRLIPDAASRLQASGLIATFAGARPLLAFSGSSTRASREHRIEIDRYGLVSVMGGKYTTYRAMAQQTLDLIVRRFGLPVCRDGRSAGRRAEPCLTDHVTLLESAHPVVLNRWREVTGRMAPELLARLLTRYGTGAFRILELLEFEPALAQPVCPHHDVMQAECVYAMREELACTLSDLLVRRTTIAYSACQGLDMLSALTDVLQRYTRLSREELDEQIASYRRFLTDSFAFRRDTPTPALSA